MAVYDGCVAEQASASLHQGRQVRTPPHFIAYTTLRGCLCSYFFSLVGSSVKVYSIATGSVVSTLSSGASGSHTAAITSAILNPHNAFQLITGSLDGNIKVWDFLDGVLLQTIYVDHPIHFVVAHELFKDSVFISAVRKKKNKAPGKGTPIGLSL